jgi:AraC-like DNA-binding protein
LSGTISILAIRALHGALARVGADPSLLLAAVGLSTAQLDQSEARVPTAVVYRAFEEVARLTDDECFCLHAAEAMPVGTFEVLDFAMRSSATIGEALARAVRYWALMDDGSLLRVEIGATTSSFVGLGTVPPSPRPASELVFELLFTRGRQLTGLPWPVRDVSFIQGPPRDRAGHERFFGVPVQFGARRNELVFDSSWLDTPCLTYDPQLSSYFDRHADALLKQLGGARTWLDEVKQSIAVSIRGSDPALESTAKQLATSARTLQRRLADLGTSHTELVEEVRRDLALKLLADRTIAISEVAYLLGFFDTSTFHRAFKRWTGATPAEYRHSVAGPPSSGR